METLANLKKNGVCVILAIEDREPRKYTQFVLNAHYVIKQIECNIMLQENPTTD